MNIKAQSLFGLNPHSPRAVPKAPRSPMFLCLSGDYRWDTRTAIKIQLVSSYQSKFERPRFHFNASLSLLLATFGFNSTICISNDKRVPRFRLSSCVNPSDSTCHCDRRCALYTYTPIDPRDSCDHGVSMTTMQKPGAA